MKTILFPTDFSDSTTTALGWAKLFARHYQATLILLHVQQVSPTDNALPALDTSGMGTYDAELAAGMEATDHNRLNALASQLRAEGLTCRAELRWGAVTNVTVATADHLQADLIIIGRSEINNFFERLMGTEATAVAREAHCPVLVVPTGETNPPQIKTILFSTNLGFDQPTEFGQVVAIAHTFEATLRGVHVHAENQPSIVDTHEMIAQLQAVYGPEPLIVDMVDARTTTGGIETYLTTNHPDLLVMVNRERNFLTGLLNPSLTDRMIISTDIPILVYHAHGDL